MLVAGRVGRPHGLDGSFHVTQPRTALLAQDELTVEGRPRRVVRRAGTDDRPILRLDGVADRGAAEAIRGADLLADRGAAPPLGEDEWYAEDLAGCLVTDGDRELGVVARMLPLPSCEALEVKREGEPDLLVPLVTDAVRSVDIEARRIDVDASFLGV